MPDSGSVSTSTADPASQSRFKSIFASSHSKSITDESPKSAPPKPEWMDASLPDKERWKKWEKERDQQFYGKGGTAGYFSNFYRGSKAWWVGILGSWTT